MTTTPFPIIGIGASAGGLDAFHTFFDNMPTDCGMAFVMILHLPADRKSMLTEILGRWTRMRVMEGSNGVLIEPNVVYVPPPHSIVTLEKGHLRVRVLDADDQKLFRPIDGFFDSLGSAMQEQAVGIVMSGTGSDGALGLKALKECGGLTIAQGTSGNSPQYGEMPAGAIATGSVDLVAPVEDIPGHLIRLKGTRALLLDAEPESGQSDEARLAICAILRTQLGHDFSGYRDKTFMRRVARRMQVVNTITLADYIRRLQADHSEVVLLFRDLLIRVTSFFRDRETFDALKLHVIPGLFEGKQADANIRVWVPGCATGEEAYSLAMLLCEHRDQLRVYPKIQIFATDIDESAITTARVGRYPPSLLEDLPDERRKRFFILSQGGFRVSKEIRDLCTFSSHNLVRDPPFSRMNLVSCRNLLIYMDTELQDLIIPVFHYALAPGGILLLGGSESASRHLELFESIDKAARIFKRRNVRSPALNLSLQRPQGVANRFDPGPSLPPVIDHMHERHDAAKHQRAPYFNERRLVSNSSPASHFSGLADRTDRPSSHGVNRWFRSIFPQAAELRQLRGNLSSTQEDLQSLIEEHQTALEELRSANEELHSVNEEMQSTNEELETSKEELQSLNEELHTVNVRLTEKVSELDQTNSDLGNLFDSTQIATIFLDRHLIIRSFTPAIGALYNLIPSDEGRSLSDIASRLHYSGLREDVARVLETLQPLERRISRNDNSIHYIMRILPYREADSSVSGALVTFVDVTSIVQAEAALVEADARKDVFLATLSHELRNPLAPIRTATHLLQSPNLTPEQLARAQTIISRQVAHMSKLLDDLLDVARITRGAFSLKKEYVNAESLLEAAVEAVQPALESKHHTLRVEPPPSSLMVEVDPVRLTQVISNLLTNAAKYTAPHGAITLGTRVETNWLIFFVRDNGLGIAADMLPKVFTMFTQIDSDGGRSEGGLGIGLALAKGLADLHGGRIEAYSAGLGKGSEFSVWLPRSVMSEAPSRSDVYSQKPLADSPTLRILVADDNIDGAETMQMLLEISGHEVTVAHTGAAALQEAKRFRPDAAVLDIGMPDMDGYEVARRIRSEAWGERITLIALTGWGQEDDKRLAAAAGFDHHLTKPMDPDRLESLLKASRTQNEAYRK